MNVIIEQSPHIRRKDSLNRMMGDVLIALSPVIIFALIVYQSAALRNILVSCFTMVALEFLFVATKLLFENISGSKKGLAGKRLKDVYHLSNVMVPLVSGTIFGLITPATFWKADYSEIVSANPWADGYAYLVLFVGAAFGIIVGKLIFGGTGKNIFNPAAAGFVFCKFVFGARYAVDKYTTTAFSWEIATGSTVLHGNTNFATSFYTGTSVLDLLIGNTAGLMGETCKIAILIGLVYLLIRHTVDWRVVASFFGTFIFGIIFVGVVAVSYNPALNYMEFVLAQLFAGGVIFGGVFMITDPVTMPLSKPNRVLYGMIIAICTLCFRYLATGGEHYIYEGMAFSILIGNAITPILDYTKLSLKTFGTKEIIVMAALPVAMVTVVTLSKAGTLGLFAGAQYTPSSSSSGTGTGGTSGSWSSALNALLPFFRF